MGYYPIGMCRDMMDIRKISTKELKSDLLETKNDIVICQNCLELGITEYSGGKVKDRLLANLKIEKAIEKELNFREFGSDDLEDLNEWQLFDDD